MTIRVTTTGQAKLRRVARKLQAGADLQAMASAELNRAAPPVLNRVRSAVRSADFPAVPSRGGAGSTGLREHLAASTVTRPLRAGVRFVVADPNGQQMARYTDGQLPRWRHPVFGNRRAWVTQRADPWFFVNIRPARPQFAGAVQRAVRRFLQRLQ